MIDTADEWRLERIWRYLSELGHWVEQGRQPRVEEDVSLIVSPVRVIQYYNKCNGRSIDNDDKREGIEMISALCSRRYTGEEGEAAAVENLYYGNVHFRVKLHLRTIIIFSSIHQYTGQLHND